MRTKAFPTSDSFSLMSYIFGKKDFGNVVMWLLINVYLRYTTMMPSVLRFPAEISILKKEVFNNWYKLRTYYLASIITSTPIHVNHMHTPFPYILLKFLIIYRHFLRPFTQRSSTSLRSNRLNQEDTSKLLESTFC